MNKVMALAIISYKEGIRNRSVLGIVFLSLIILGLNIAVAGFFLRDVGKVTVDMNLSALSFSGLLLVVFVSLNLVAKDIDKKTIHLVLSKPISRTGYIFGKYLGVLLFVLVSLLTLVGFSSATVWLLRSLYPAYFGHFSWLIFFVAIGFIYVKLAVLSAIMIFFSSLTTSSFITLIFTICSYLIGEVIEDVVFYLKSGFQEDISASLQSFIEVVSYVFPNFSVFDLKLEAAHGLAVAPSRIVYSLGYAALYSFILLLLASLIFNRREFT
jgi:ABC-type transport system involved in multi-copper enzyme maturation permease subunit